MSHNHIKTIEFKKDSYTYELEIDTEDKENLIIEQVTTIDGPIKSDTDLDPEEFTANLDDDDWLKIEQLIKGE